MDEPLPHITGDTAQPRYVGFWVRFIAFIIDSIWTGIVIGIVISLLYGDAILALADLPPDASPEEVAALVAFLCSDEAAFINGSVYTIDGAMTSS